MLDESTRVTILQLHTKGHGTRAIARALGISRGAVRDVLKDGHAEVPAICRPEKGEPHRDEIVELYAQCKGNLVRVHEKLLADGADLSYQALTAFCRKHGIGYEAPPPAGQYTFVPGEESQHDTSPHEAEIGGRLTAVQTASEVLCFSRMIFAQMYPRFRRFECKVFLTEAATYFDGVCDQRMVDNTHVVVQSGTGRDMVPAPEMAAFSERFGFTFCAHEKGDANRSARVERPFDFIDNNFLAGRTFADWNDANGQLRVWCDKVNGTYRKHLHASPRELYATERIHMHRLPIYIPPVYMLHQRIVDTEGFVNVDRNRYSVPWQLIGRQLEVRESWDQIEVFEGPRCVASHKRVVESRDARVINPAHRPARNQGMFAQRSVSDEERRLTERMPQTAAYIALLKKRGRTSTRDLRWLLRMVNEYPQEALSAALAQALRYGMSDLDRLERMVLRQIARDFFVLPHEAKADPDDSEDDDDG
jgi:hypothetical protein